jgi:hypothetical protein
LEREGIVGVEVESAGRVRVGQKHLERFECRLDLGGGVIPMNLGLP